MPKLLGIEPVMFIKLISFQTQILLQTGFFVQQACLSPLTFFFFLYLPSLASDRQVSQNIWLQAAIAGLWASTICAMGIISYQRFQGTLEHLAISPLNSVTVFSPLCIAATTIGLLGVPLSILCQFLFTKTFTVHVTDILALSVAYPVCAVSGLLLAAIFVRTRDSAVFEPILLAPVWLLSGLVIPFVTLPEWLKPVALLHPLTGAIGISSADTPQVAALWALQALAVCLIYALLASWLLRRALRAAHKDGSLGLA